jgi:L-fuculose-phosphate aldolase
MAPPQTPAATSAEARPPTPAARGSRQGLVPLAEVPEPLVTDLSPHAELAVLARALCREGYDEHIAGHISIKQPDGTLLVNPYHIRWDELRASHIARIDLDGNQLEGTWPVNPAIRLHLVVHQARHDVGVAVHNHPRWGTVWANIGRVPPVYDQTGSLVGTDLPFYDDYERPVSDLSEAQGVVNALGDHRAALLAHHGVLVVANDAGQAYARCMSLEWRCRQAWHVEQMGTPKRMNPDAVERLARGIDKRGYPGLFEAMARLEIERDPRVLA